MKNTFISIIFILFFASSTPVAFADTLPLLLECGELNSTDMSTQMAYEIDSRIAGVTASDSTKMLWATRGNGSSGWQRSTTVWTKNGDVDLDFTGASPWNSNSLYVAAGTLISPRHIALAHHAHIPIGQTIIFVDNSNNIVTRTITARAQIGSTDLEIALLDSDVPAGIAYYPVIDLNTLKNYWKTFPNTPIIVLDQEDKALIKNTSSASGTNFYYTDPSSPRNNFNETLIGGDSGNPLFVVIGGRLVFVSTIYSITRGPFSSSLTDDINTAMTSLGGGYQISPLDLSCFTNQSSSTPSFSAESYDLSIPENSANSTSVGTVSATGGSNTAHSFTAGNTGSVFAVNSSTGAITVNNGNLLDYEDTTSYALTLLANATNSDWYWPIPGSDSSTVNITVTDVAEEPEFSAVSYTFSISENILTGGSVGSVSATDPDAGDVITYSITAGNTDNVFAINSSTGAITVADANYIDYDENSSYDLTVQAIDDGDPAQSSTVPVTVNVTTGDRPVAVFSASSSSYNENGGSVNVGISLDSAYTKDVVLTIGHEVTTAVLNTDFSLSTNTLTIPAGSISGNFPVTLMHNTNSTSNRVFTLSIDTVDKATIGSPSSHTLTIINVDSSGGGGGGGGSSVVNITTPPKNPGLGCQAGFTFSPITGLPCASSPIPSSCQSGWIFNPTTGQRCGTSSVLSSLTPNTTSPFTIATPSTITTSLIPLNINKSGIMLVRKGSIGESCKAWQTFLNTNIDANLTVDGICGPLTIAAAKKWQASVGLVPDGLLGPASRAKAMMQ